MLQWSASVYHSLVLKHPVITLILVGILAGISSLRIDQFRLDASADSLVLEDDKDLEFYRQMRGKFTSSDDFLVVTFSPAAGLFTQESIRRLRALRDEIQTLPRVASTNSILNVPLLHDPDLTLSNVSEHIRSLDTHEVPLDQAREALVSNPLYRDLLISADAGTTMIQVNLKTDPAYYRLLDRREELRERRRQGPLTLVDERELEMVSAAFNEISEQVASAQDSDVAKIREIMHRHRDQVQAFLGGVPMIVSDMVSFVRSDLNTFGWGVLAFIVLTLVIIFRQWQWVLLPLVCCITTVWLEIGLLAWLEWPITVISSNFVSLLLITTLSLTIHIIVRYREYQRLEPNEPQEVLAWDTVKAMAIPCLYMALTTIVAFGSLTLSGIRPVIDFGWMMTYGIGLAFVVAFVVMPAMIVVLPKSRAPHLAAERPSITIHLSRFTEKHGSLIVVVSLVLALACVAGLMKLSVENRFIDYFKPSTEIYQGMVVIDEKMGGTTPLDVIIDDIRTPASQAEKDPFLSDDPFASGCADNPEDQLAEEDCQPEEEVRNTWYTWKKMAQLEEIHDYLDQLPESGKVLSIATTLKLTQQINQGKKLNALELAFLPAVFPEELKGILIDPYLSEENAQAKFNVRLIESSSELKRNELIEKIRAHLVNQIGIEPERIHFTGMAVLYNNMLQSLFNSQIKTLGAVFVAITLMFLVLFRSLKLALIGIAPNLLAAASVLGAMGWAGVSLDLMTITVASITVGIAVDNTIHYIHRFQAEFEKDRDYIAAMHRCHGTIGRAMFYTSLTIIVGFSILAASNFIPTIYFGLFTGMAMLVALLGALTLLPQLLVLFKPLGESRG